MTGWTALVPLKSLPGAKTRLRDVSRTAADHGRLVHAMRADTLAAITATPAVARVLVVVDHPDADHADALVQSRVGLNAALDEAAQFATSRWSGDGVVAIVADLPGLQSADLASALRCAADHDRSYVPDIDGIGTTLLAAGPRVALCPMFGPNSAARHRASGAVALPASASLRTDVDTVPDLRRAVEIGVGRQTAAWLNQNPSVFGLITVVDR